MNFSLRLMEAMVNQGLKQKELAALSGIPQGAISNYCNEKAMPSADALFRLSRSLGVSMEWLISGENEPNFGGSKGSDVWQRRAIIAEEKLSMLKGSMEGWLKKI